MSRPVFPKDPQKTRTQQLRARLITRLGEEYRTGALTFEQFEQELAALTDYLSSQHGLGAMDEDAIVAGAPGHHRREAAKEGVA